MIQLIAYNQSSEAPTYLDIDEDEDISLNFAVSEVKDFSTRKSNRSDSFSLPFTDTNNQFFNHLYNVNLATGDFDIYQRTNCEIRVDSLPQIKGYLYVNSINLTTERYEVTIIGEVGNLKDILGEKKLSDLDNDWMNSFTHTLNKDNIVASWSFNVNYATTPQDQSGIVYPFINYGIDNRVWTLGGSNDIRTESGAIQPYEFKPAFRVKTLFERILAEAGYSYDSNFLNNNDFEFDRIYMNLASEFDIVKSSLTNYGFKAYKNARQQITTISSTKIAFQTESYDLQGQYSAASSQYTAPLNGTYEFKVKLQAEWVPNGSEGNAKFNVILVNNGAAVYTSQDYFITSAGTSDQTLYFPVNFLTNDVVEVHIQAEDGSTGLALNEFYVNLGEDITYFQLTQQPSTPVGRSIYLQDNLPNIQQIDFLKAIFEHFNMFVEPKQDNPTELLIEPYPDYMDRGTTIDWTDKLDYNKEVQIIPTTEFRNKTVEFKWLEGKGYAAKYAQDIRTYNYGSYTYTDKSDLVEGEFNNFTKFIEPTNRLIPIVSTTQIYPICLMDLSGRDDDGNVVPSKDKPVIFYFRKKELGNNVDYYIFDNDTNVNDEVDSYGYAGHFSDVPTDTTTYDLNWSNQSPIYNQSIWQTTSTKLNPFIQYYNSYINEIYSEEARLLKGKFYLTPIDIHNLRFNNKIFIKDCYYRINKITNYKPNRQEPCDVELIKIFDAKIGLGNTCDLVPSSFLESGIVRFKDGNGDDATSTKDCCLAYGYLWLPDDCYWKAIGGTNGDPLNPTPIDGNPEE